MAVSVSAPGVYIEELPGPAPSISGVATSVTAFIGRAPQGPVNSATLVTSFGDYQRQFGGLWATDDLGHVVSQYFTNGGRIAYVVRVHEGATPSEGTVPGPSLRLEPTAAVTALANFDHLSVAVTHGTTATAYTLAITAEDSAGAPLTSGSPPAPVTVSVNLDTGAADPGATIAAASTGTPPIALAALVGSAPSERPAETGSTPIDGEAGGPVLVPLPSVFTFRAANPGVWGDGVAVTITPDPSGTRFGITAVLTNAIGTAVATENFVSLSLDTDAPTFAGAVLEQQSALLRLVSAPTALPSAETTGTLSNGGDGTVPGIAAFAGDAAGRTGIHALDDLPTVSLLSVPFPASSDTATITARAGFWSDTAIPWCKARGAMAIIDPPGSWSSFDAVSADLSSSSGWLTGLRSPYAAQYFPDVMAPDALQENRLRAFPPSGIVAGVMARVDATRGVWKAPAGTEARMAGVLNLSVLLTDAEQGVLNREGINCARLFPGYGPIVWGARTLYGEDRRASEWKYVPVRRLMSFIQQSLKRGTEWAVFEGNDETLWSQLRLSVEGFLQPLFLQGAFAGTAPQEAYFVRCDGETTTQADIDAGIVNVLIGVAPVRPAEFVIIRIQQIAGQ